MAGSSRQPTDNSWLVQPWVLQGQHVQMVHAYGIKGLKLTCIPAVGQTPQSRKPNFQSAGETCCDYGCRLSRSRGR